MSFSLTTHRIRCQSDYSDPGAIINRLTGKAIKVPLASDVRFEIGIFAGLNGSTPSAAAQVADDTGWQSLSLTFQSMRGDGNVVSKTVTSFTTPTISTWNADTGQHCVVDLTDAELNIPPGKYRLALTVQHLTYGPFPVGTADVTVYHPNNLNSSDPADESPGAPLSRDQADALYASAGGSNHVGNSLFVDVDGDDDHGLRERFDKPYQTITAALDAALSNDTIFVRPGGYTNVGNLTPDKLVIGSSVTRASNIVTVTTATAHGFAVGHLIMQFFGNILVDTQYDGVFVVDTVPTATSYTIRQFGSNAGPTSLDDSGAIQPFIHLHFEAGAVVRAANGSSLFDGPATAYTNYHFFAVTGHGYFSSLNKSLINMSENSRPFFEGDVFEARMSTTPCGVLSGVCQEGYLIAHKSIRGGGHDALENPTPIANGFLYIEAPLIEAGFDFPTGACSPINLYGGSANSNIIVKAGLLKTYCVNVGAVFISPDGASRPGKILIEADRAEGISSGVEITGAGGDTSVSMRIKEIEATAGPGVLSHNNPGTSLVRISGATITSTYNNAAGYAVSKTASGGTLILDNCTLVPHATANVSINSGGASRTVTCHGSKTAYAIGTGVTANGLLIDSTVL